MKQGLPSLDVKPANPLGPLPCGAGYTDLRHFHVFHDFIQVIQGLCPCAFWNHCGFHGNFCTRHEGFHGYRRCATVTEPKYMLNIEDSYQIV